MATPITITIPHKLGRAEARSRVDASVGRFKQQLAAAGLGRITHQWADDRVNFHASMMGQTITGRVDVNDDNLKIEVDLPAILAAFADKIAGRLRKEGTLLIEKK